MRDGYSFVLVPPAVNTEIKPTPLFCRFSIAVGAGVAPQPAAAFMTVTVNAAWNGKSVPAAKLLLRTSGSMGTSKIVVHGHDKLMGNAANCARKYGFRAESRCVIPIPIAHMYGFGAEFLPAIQVGASIDQRFYKPLQVTGQVRLLDDGNYMIVGPTHGGWGREVRKESFAEMNVGPRAVLRFGNKIDVIFSEGQYPSSRKDRDYLKSAGIVMEEKQIIVVKSNQAHRASFEFIPSAAVPRSRGPRQPPDPLVRWRRGRSTGVRRD